MKTILYQPLFINPQAYFVFPQLYHIEKGDSYIEPANITGQLIINDLTKVLTSTPTLNVVQDTNQVDFGLFKGKHIRISQYTNIGAVVLGEWYIPGTPEPEQPDWFKESIVAWYSPCCKQGMTNFDVIESYADDFTKWRIENTGVTSTQKKIVIAAGTELKYNVTYKGFGNSIAEFDIKYTGNAVIRYQYNKEDGTTGIITINRSGIYHLPASIKAQKNFGFYCNPQTVTEETTIEQLPTSILKDFSGNKHDAYLYGFKGKLNSGVGIYAQDFKKANYPNQLCYDGKSYAVAYGLPILTDYTIIADRTWFNYIQRACFLSKILHAGKGAFGFEMFNEKNEYGTYSFGTFNNVAEFDKNIVYQTKKSYNGRKSLIHGPVSITDYDELYLGKLRSNEKNMFIGCHGDIFLFNRSLTEYEISWVKNNMMCSKQQEPDIDL